MQCPGQYRSSPFFPELCSGGAEARDAGQGGKGRTSKGQKEPTLPCPYLQTSLLSQRKTKTSDLVHLERYWVRRLHSSIETLFADKMKRDQNSPMTCLCFLPGPGQLTGAWSGLKWKGVADQIQLLYDYLPQVSFAQPNRIH